ncbi:MAG TPA: acetyl-CoA synthase subunit gamma [Firmicutes bacterium]|jgi:hypothetical protein|nr:acetyl-CoA synthase subunit gamma [Bacillota bacterium]
MTDSNKVQAKPCCGTPNIDDSQGCTCTPSTVTANQSAPWIIGSTNTSVGVIPQINTQLTFQDRLGSWKSRWDIGRMDYKVTPGLYAVGKPDGASPVLVSANYKMSFDKLRQELSGPNLWILVLDTKGVNVWCAAGKGTFGTQELIQRIAQVKLAELVTHRRLVLPQLGAPGIAAHEVLKTTGFKIIYGPVRASDIPEYLAAGMNATEAMREVRFGLMDRLVLTPVELVAAFKPALIILGLLVFINIILHGSLTVYQFLGRTLLDFLPFCGAIFAGAVLVPLFLPLIPGRALAAKGWLFGLFWAGIYLKFIAPTGNGWHIATYLLLLPPVVSFLAMNFTGSTTYTSLSGVVKEMKVAIPAQIIAVGLGILLLMGQWFA